MLTLKRKSILTCIVRERTLNVTQAQIDAWKAGDLIQDAMPQLTPSDREWIKTGVTAEEWDEAYGAEDEDVWDEE